MDGSSRRRVVEPQAALVGDLEGGRRLLGVGVEALLEGGRRPLQPFGAELRPLLVERCDDTHMIGHADQVLQAEGQLDDQLGRLRLRLADRPRAVGALAPRRPVEREVGPHPGRVALAGQAVGGLEGEIAEEDVHLEALLDSLLLEQGALEGFPERADHVEKDVVDHGLPRLLRRVAW